MSLQEAVCGWAAPHGVRVPRKGFPISACTWGAVFVAKHLSGEAVPSRQLMLLARLGPLPCKSP